MTELEKKQIEVQLSEYEQAVKDAVAWHNNWKARQAQRGFRCMEKQIQPTQ